MKLLLLPALLLPLSSSTQPNPPPPTNLPPPTDPGIFTASTRILISNTTAALAYAALANFPAYPSWNPFVRFALVTTPTNLSLPTQTPREGAHLFLRVQIPALPLPVNEHTPDDPAHTHFSYELITAVQPERGRLAWRYVPDVAGVLQAERWQAVSEVSGGQVLYESREVFSGVGAVAVREALGKGLQESFVAQGVGLKMLLEGR